MSDKILVSSSHLDSTTKEISVECEVNLENILPSARKDAITRSICKTKSNMKNKTFSFGEFFWWWFWSIDIWVMGLALCSQSARNRSSTYNISLTYHVITFCCNVVSSFMLAQSLQWWNGLNRAFFLSSLYRLAPVISGSK